MNGTLLIVVSWSFTPIVSGHLGIVGTIIQSIVFIPIPSFHSSLDRPYLDSHLAHLRQVHILDANLLPN